MSDKTKLERITGSLPVHILSTAIAVMSENPWAWFIPMLTNNLANSRYQQRVEKQLKEYAEIFRKLPDKLKALPDAQYKLLNELILCSLKTNNEEKLRRLRYAVENSIIGSYTDFDSMFLSRVLGEVSVDELLFLNNIDLEKEIAIEGDHTYDQDYIETVNFYSDDTIESEMIRSLFNMGILKRGSTTLGQNELYKITSAAHKLLGLITDPSSPNYPPTD